MGRTIRKMLATDIPDGVWITEANWPNCERVKRSILLELSDMFSNAVYRPTYFVVEEDEKIVGFAGWNWGWHNYDIYELFWCNVLESHRRRGIGHDLVEARLADIREVAASEIGSRKSYVTLSTHLDKHYERHGFRTIATMNLWQNPQTHLMIREI